MKVVINRCYGGFSVSKKAAEYMAAKGNKEAENDLTRESFYSYAYERTDPLLIEAIETLGEEANGDCAELVIVDVPDDVEWYIDEYDGMESIHENHRSWG